MTTSHVCTCGHRQTVHTGGGVSDRGLCFPLGTISGSPADRCPCDQYTESGPTPHHPTSAELAAFRRSLMGPYRHDLAPFTASSDGGAWSHERDRGIGYHEGDLVRHVDTVANVLLHARREAAAMRAHAFWDGPADGWTARDLFAFAPR
jgi:hypothetical protein